MRQYKLLSAVLVAGWCTSSRQYMRNEAVRPANKRLARACATHFWHPSSSSFNPTPIYLCRYAERLVPTAAVRAAYPHMFEIPFNSATK